MKFEDHFSKQSAIYRLARPTYPDELFSYLAQLAPAHHLCWDSGTGNGQAAVSLSAYFDRVIATDPSQEQIKNAIAAPKVEYRVASAEESGLPDHYADLLTAATAAHWFEHAKFYPEARRVLKPNGIIALWTYSMAHISPAIDELMNWWAYDYLLPYWPDGRWYVRQQYTTLPFPFEAMETPAFHCTMHWTRDQWLNYLRSWSAYNKYIGKHSTDPIEETLIGKLSALWPEQEVKEITWPLHLKCARVSQ